MMRIAIAQTAPVFLDREATLAKAVGCIREAGAQGARLVAFGEALVPGYPVWLDRTGGARFDDGEQKAMHGLYAEQGVVIERGDLGGVCDAAREVGAWVALGVVERPGDRGGHTLYCSLVMIDDAGVVRSVHRKLMPTHEERLCWGIGDGHGLVTHAVDGFTVGALNCWENWMPLARAALHAQGEDLHVMTWPGSARNTRDITRFAAREGRSYAVSASVLLRAGDIPAGVPMRDRIVGDAGEVIHDGGSAIAGPDGAWVVEPVVGEERVIVADLHPKRVLEERQNFDPSGHYARSDVLRVSVDRTRQGGLAGR